MEQVRLAKIAVEAAPYAIDKPYDYLVPQSLWEKVRTGVRVTVPFGRGNKVSEGMVLGLGEGEKTPELKTVLSVLDDSPVLDDEGIKMALWMRERYFCTLYSAIRTILPAGLWFRVSEIWKLTPTEDSAEAKALLAGKKKLLELFEALERCGGQAELETLKELCGPNVSARLKELQALGLAAAEVGAQRKISDKTVKRISLAIPPEEAMALAEAKRKSSPLRYEVIRLLCAIGSGISSEICYFTGCSAATVNALVKAGICVAEQEETFRVPVLRQEPDGPEICLNSEQQQVFEGISRLTKAGKPSCSLLYGVTGSGKTLVYIRLLQEVVKNGRQGMILVPEIALTPQMMEKFSAYFGDKVVMLHSSLKMSERYDQWKRIRRGDVQVVLGTRSAVFAPLENIGMIILDEEQEGSYQSENLPRYHARDVAKFRCSRSNAALVLGSATPTVDSAWQAKRGSYHLFHLEKRYNEQPLPQVIIADLKDEVRAGNTGAVSALLREELQKNIEKGEQSILFLNRRGSSRMLQCMECGAVPECPRCSVPLTYHSANGRLMCHYCNYSERAEAECEACGGPLKHVGTGTQKVEEELGQLFPGVEILRMDADTVAGNHEKLLKRFEKEKIPILLGTQMVAKGLDFENVTLVGVLAADLSLYVDHYSAAERTFSLLTQVVGRAGRGKKTGRAVIQTFTPDNEVIVSAARQDYRSFFQSELRLRQARRQPPFADVFTLTVSGRQEGEVLRAATKLREGMKLALQYLSAANAGTELLGPAPAPILRLNDRYRYRLFWIGKNDHATRELLGYYLKAFYEQKENRNLNLFIDCNAMD